MADEAARWAAIKADPAKLAKAREKNRRAQKRRAHKIRAQERAKRLAEAPKRKRATAQRKLDRAAKGTSTTRRWYMGWCAECGEPWLDHQPSRVVCSHKCARRRVRKTSRAKHGRLDNYRKRARLLGVEYEPVSRRAVFERDGYRCGICGRKVNPNLPATHERGATLDHIVPMNSVDLGSHTYANVQCAHRDCNWRKGRRGASQLLLIA